jgi:hypothetical protein
MPTLEALAKADPAQLKTLGLRANEPNTMIEVAKGLIQFGSERNITGDDAICRAWGEYAEEWRRTPKLDPYVGVKGIGIALYAYLRMRSGADAIKPDVWIARLLQEYGATIRNPKDALEVMQCAEQVALAAKISRLTLDQMLWRGEWKITPAALKQLGTTEAWRSHAPADTTPEEIYGKNGSMSHLFNEPFATRADLQDALGQNHGGGVKMEVIEALARAGANCNQADTGGRTPIWVACLNGHVKCVDALIRLGADMERHGRMMGGSHRCSWQANAAIQMLSMPYSAPVQMSTRQGIMVPHRWPSPVTAATKLALKPWCARAQT